MTMSVAATVEVAVGPEVAFEVFTAEIASWYLINGNTVADPSRTQSILFEAYVGGRLLDVHDIRTKEGIELARVTAWEPGSRVAFTDRAGTEVEVTFTSRSNGTRVVLEHRGLERIRPDHRTQAGRFGWRLLLPWYRTHMKGRTQP